MLGCTWRADPAGGATWTSRHHHLGRRRASPNTPQYRAPWRTPDSSRAHGHDETATATCGHVCSGRPRPWARASRCLPPVCRGRMNAEKVGRRFDRHHGVGMSRDAERFGGVFQEFIKLGVVAARQRLRSWLRVLMGERADTGTSAWWCSYERHQVTANCLATRPCHPSTCPLGGRRGGLPARRCLG